MQYFHNLLSFYQFQLELSLPTITFSLRPFNVSTLPNVAASVNTFVVSWKDAAEINELVCKLALVIPSKTGSKQFLFFLHLLKFYLFLKHLFFEFALQQLRFESPGSLIRTF